MHDHHSRHAQIERIFHNFHAIRRAYSGGSRFSSRHYGMSFMQASVLMMLMHEHDQTIGQLAMNLGISKSAMSQLLEGLIERGFVERQVSLDDRRVAYAKLTEKGVEHLKQVRREGMREMMQLFDRLDEDEITHIERITEKLAHETMGSAE